MREANQLRIRPDPAPTWTFFMIFVTFEKICCQIGIGTSKFIKYYKIQYYIFPWNFVVSLIYSKDPEPDLDP
jgi:hypothetical protein